MTAIGDALRKAGINTTEESSPESQRRISLETRIGYMREAPCRR